MTNTIEAKVRCHNAMHRVLLRDDGTFETPDCPDAAAKASKVAAMIRLGDTPPRNIAGCMPLVALCSGLPAIVQAGRVAARDLGTWSDLYIRYEEHRLVRVTIRNAYDLAMAPHLKTIKRARAAIATARYWHFVEKTERKEHVAEYVRFLPATRIEVGKLVAEEREDEWEVPLQPDWLNNVPKPVIDGRFIVGTNLDHAGFVYGIDRDDESGNLFVREFAIINGKLGKIKG